MMSDLAEKIGNALRDENGLLPTGASLDVLITTLVAIDKTDERWDHAGVPSTTDYATSIVEHLDRSYLRNIR